ncbi:MAG: HAD family hydrolase [Bacillales bacterium]|nr:HAD family hydrolase [Bacillales bacterium]
MLQNIELVLFDLDNTLFPFDSYWNKATTDIFYRSDLTKDLPIEEFFSYYRHYDHYFWKLHQEGQISLDEVRQQRLIHALKHFDRDICAEDADHFFQEFFSRLIYLLKPEEEVYSFLQELKKSYKVGIITNGKSSEQRTKLKKLNLFDLFTEEEMFISEETGYEKPQREAFLLPLSHYGIAPEQAVYIGDSWINDIEGATNVGMNAIWINPNGNEVPNTYKPVFVTESMVVLKEKWTSFVTSRV